MPLILAVEPDRRQAAHLTHIVRQRVGAELVLAETTELALAQIGNRVPDLILVPALLSPADDAALAAALRVIASAAHVQMVTTPLFGSAAPERKARGVLAAFRRAKPSKPATDGCDPAEFAQQISSYLESATEERATAQYVESPIPVRAAAPRPIADAPQRYVPLEPGRLYRDETAGSLPAHDTTPGEALPEPDMELREAVPAAENLEPIAEFEAKQGPAYEPPYIEPYVERIYEPVETAPEQVLEAPEQLHEASEPSYEAPEPPYEAPEPSYEAPELLYESPASLHEVSEPLLDASEPLIDAPEPTLETAEQELEASEPVLATPEPVFDAPEPALEATEPTVETPEPLAAHVPAQPRRIGFVVDDEEQEFTSLAAESLDIDVDPNDVAASVDTPFAVEVVNDEEPAFAASTEDEVIELVDIDLSSAFSEFDELHVVDAQQQSYDDAVELPETPEIVAATPFGPPQPRVIEADSLTEFAAAVEALTASEQTAGMPDAAAEATLPEFDDLFPPRQPVEPSPLGTWRSWAPLEGITAEAWEAPVPAHVVERAVERAPERPDWVQLVESLRVDVERRRSEQTSSAPKAPRKTPTPTPTRPVQDEWGLFDPAQCGFAALLAKLDEITEANQSRPRP